VNWVSISVLMFALLLAERARGDEDLIIAPSPDDEREGNDEDDQYDVYENSQHNICHNIADGVCLPYVNDCDKFIECENGTIKEVGSCTELGKGNPQFCPDPEDCRMGFDSFNQICTYEENVRCLPRCETNALSSYCYDNTCSKYVLCYYGRPVIRACQDGLQYNSKTDRCDFPRFVDCVSNDCSPNYQPKDIIYLGSKASCSRYFICSNGHPWEQECEPGLAYNPDCKCCDFAGNVNCTADALARNIKPYARTPLRRADITCPPKGVSFHPHKSKRSAYYYCLDGRGVTLDCTPGLLYDPKVEECREPQNIGL
ncbi:hypothetical protein KR018_010162, partial [Drosophila ironensis]